MKKEAIKKQSLLLSLFVVVLVWGSGLTFGYHDTLNVVVNGKRLSPETIYALEQYYGVRIQSGRYWYDRISGLWGREGGPTVGQILSGLNLGGPLSPRASGGGTGVFINGRELHPAEVAYLQRCTPVYRGRYWLNPQGLAGVEGGPPLVNLSSLCQQAYGGNRGKTLREKYGSFYSDYGGVTGGGGVIGFTDSSGTGITCGPDGGCIR